MSRAPSATVTAVIPTHNQRTRLESLLRDLARQSLPLQEVLVVDNGSRDGSAGMARERGARILAMGSNTGFARAVNRGIKESRQRYVAVLNDDVRLDSGWLSRLVKKLESGGGWFATGKILRADGSSVIDGTFDEVSRAGCAWRCGEGREDGPRWSRPQEISFAPFTAAVFRRELFDKVGLLDERFESYLEDVDFGLRCALAGFRGAYEPEAVARHHGSSTLGKWDPRKVRLIARNQVLLVAKHYPPGWWRRLGWPVLVGQLLWALVALRHGTGGAWCRGKLEGLRLFRAHRGEGRPGAGVVELLSESERRIRRLQAEDGFERYWRWYFTLT